MIQPPLRKGDEIIILNWNCKSITNPKLDVLRNWLETGLVDIIALQETMQPPHGIRNEAHLIASSPIRTRKDTQSTLGGISFFGSTRIIQHYKSTPVSDTKILSIDINGHILSSIYVSPNSQNHQDFLEMLRLSSSSDFIMGDFNCPPGFDLTFIPKYSWTSSQKARTEALLEHVDQERLGLSSIPDSGFTSKWDHIWTSPKITQISHTFFTAEEVKAAGLNSDHGMQFLKVANFLPKDSTDQICSNSLATRFKSKSLNNPNKRLRLHHQFTHFSQQWQEEIFSHEPLLLNQLDIPSNVKQRQDIVDSLHDTMMTCLTNTSYSLGTYNAAQIKAFTRKSLREDLQEISSLGDANKAFKRASRATNPVIVATNPQEVHVTIEAQQIYQSVYSTTEPAPVRPTSMGTPMTISFQQLHSAIHNYSTSKACGQDGIDQQILRNLSYNATFLSLLKSTFNLFMLLKTTPNAWNHSLIHLLAKEVDENKCKVDNTRPISLTPLLRRIFESIILRHLFTLKPTWMKLNPCQGGFSKRRSTEAHILLSHYAATHHQCPSKLQVFLDISKAFDQISHTYIINTLKARNVPDSWIELFYSLMMQNTSSTIMVNHLSTSPINRSRGVFQGSLLSPTLFNLAIDQLANMVNSPRTPYPKLLLFADDIKIQIPGYNLAATQSILDQCTAWASEANLSFGIKKCGAIGLKDQDRLTINNQTIPSVASYNYLGIPIRNLGIDWETHMNSRIDQAEGILRFLFSQAKSGLSEAIRVDLVKTRVRSTLQYGLGLYTTWTKIAHSTLDKACQGRIKERLKKYSRLEMEYCIGSRIPQTIAYSMLDLPSISQLQDYLFSSLSLQLLTQESSSPLKYIMNLQMDKKLSSKSLLHVLTSNTLAKESLQQPYESPKLWLKHHYKAMAHQGNLKDSALVSYISLHSRHHLKKDSVLLIPDWKLKRDAISWRGNTFTNSTHNPRKCLCGLKQDLRRTHFQDCESFKNSNIIPRHIWSRFDLLVTHRRNRRQYWMQQGQSFKHVDKITIIDYVLNKRHWKLFSSFCTALADDVTT